MECRVQSIVDEEFGYICGIFQGIRFIELVKKNEEFRELGQDTRVGIGEVCAGDLWISPQVFGDLSPEG